MSLIGKRMLIDLGIQVKDERSRAYTASITVGERADYKIKKRKIN
jgi:hypothetical protein